jgi:Protein of unknown function (DUF3122)
LNYWLNRLFAFTLTLIVSWFFFASSATALLRQHHETPGVLSYHAQDSLKDRDGNTWQVVLFPDHTLGGKTTYYLRLVGFPEVNSFNHPQTLEILTAQGKVLTAPDAYAQSAPASNVGQYDLTSILIQWSGQLSSQRSLKLSVPLQDNQELVLKIPQEILAEWQLLTQEIE